MFKARHSKHTDLPVGARLILTAVSLTATACPWASSMRAHARWWHARSWDRSAFDTSEPVPLVTVDDWVSTSDFQPDAPKFHVEGTELAVLAGAESGLDSVMVVQFKFGVTQIDQRLYLADYYGVLTDRGCDLATLTPSGLTQLKAYEEADEVFRPTNFLAIRKCGLS